VGPVAGSRRRGRLPGSSESGAVCRLSAADGRGGLGTGRTVRMFLSRGRKVSHRIIDGGETADQTHERRSENEGVLSNKDQLAWRCLRRGDEVHEGRRCVGKASGTHQKSHFASGRGRGGSGESQENRYGYDGACLHAKALKDPSTSREVQWKISIDH